MAAGSPVVPGQLSLVSACDHGGLGSSLAQPAQPCPGCAHTLASSLALARASSLTGSVLWEPAFLVNLFSCSLAEFIS